MHVVSIVKENIQIYTLLLLLISLAAQDPLVYTADLIATTTKEGFGHPGHQDAKT